MTQSASDIVDWLRSRAIVGDDRDPHWRSADEIERLRAERPGWQTMESAPRFGHAILFDPQWGVCEGNRGDDGWALATFNGTIKRANPTLWQPLPDHPALHPSVAEGRGDEKI